MSLGNLLIAIMMLILSGSDKTAFGFEMFGSFDDTKFAGLLWKTLEQERMVGENAIMLEPFFGGAKPHGMILEVSSRLVTVNGHAGFTVVKKNYNGADVTEARVERNRAKYLTSITVMFQRKKGYDPDNQNWFWSKYKPRGDLFTVEVSGQTKELAGRIVKGQSGSPNKGCLFCHASAGGGDYIFYPEIKNPHFIR
ncbi:MAG: hypothetical protein GY786_16665 [Proteobacteria bacterium]|nr:hypothetical protein [Pseudomonadota bacterium]